MIVLGLLLSGCVPRPAQPPSQAPPPPATRPSPLPRSAAIEEGECRCWHGSSQGNDPSATGLLYVCRRGERLTGTLRFESARSGTHAREVSGTYESVAAPRLAELDLPAGGPPRAEASARLRLRDDRIVHGQPAPGWRFCLVERYTLEVSTATGELAGQYASAPCRDYGRLKMSPTSRLRCMFSAIRRRAADRDLR
jgi:hypothetical protein